MMRSFAIVFVAQCIVLCTFQRAAGLEEALSQELDLRPFFHVLRPCNSSQQQFVPTKESCLQFFVDNNPLLEVVDIVGGVVEFALPFAGTYNITVAGAAGGKGVCSREAAGKGRLITVAGVSIEATDSVSVLIGQCGTSACDTAPSHFACRLSREGAANFSAECDLLVSGMSLLFDGGGGGGGFSQFRSGQSFWTAGGGGGAGAFDGDGLLSDASAVLVSATASSMNGVGSVDISAGVGGGALATTSSFPQDGNFLDRNRFRDEGGDDCLLGNDDDGIFPNTVGGFGGGGGGCGNGGGGGGHIGGDVIAIGNSSAGQGGISAIPAIGTVIQNKLNDEEDGFVSLFLDGCMCTHRCIPDFDQLTFRCACPVNTSVSPSGLDCIASDMLPDIEGTITNSELDTIGNVKTELVVLNATVTLFGMEVEFEGMSTRTFSTERTAFSDTCLVVLVFGVSVVGFSEITRIGGVDTPVHSFLISNASSSANYTSVLDSPIQVSAIEVVGVDAECEAKISWNVSTRTDPLRNSRTSIFQLSTLLPKFLATCERSEACPSLALVPTAISPPLNVALLSGLLVGGVAAGGISLLTVLLAGCYIWYKRKKMHVTLSDIRRPTPAQYQHYEMLPLESASKMQPLLHQYEAVDNYEFRYVNQDEVHARLKQLQPKHGVRERAVAGGYGLEADALCWSRKDFMFIRKLGTGRYGEIFLMQTKAKLNGVPVAVKTLQSDSLENEEAFFKEIDLMKTLHHPNIISFLGFCKESTGDLAAPPLMVLEYMALGDLLNLLIANRPNPSEESNLDVSLMCSLAADVARALLYLSEQSIVHGDVAARNILVSQDLVAKLSDFRLSGASNQGDNLHKKLPVRWMAPEMLLQKSHPSNMHTDVWAYGVLLWEMVTYGEYPYAKMETSEIMKAAGKGKLRLNCPVDCPEIFTTAIDGCHQYEPSNRTGFQELLQLFVDCNK